MDLETSEDAVGQKVNYWGDIYTIAGVVKDYCQQSPKEAFEPHIYRFMPHGRDVRGFFMMKFQPGNEERVLELAEKKYTEFFPDNPFDYFFLEDYYDQQYRDEKLLGTLFGIFALLAIIVTGALLTILEYQIPTHISKHLPDLFLILLLYGK